MTFESLEQGGFILGNTLATQPDSMLGVSVFDAAEPSAVVRVGASCDVSVIQRHLPYRLGGLNAYGQCLGGEGIKIDLDSTNFTMYVYEDAFCFGAAYASTVVEGKRGCTCIDTPGHARVCVDVMESLVLAGNLTDAPVCEACEACEAEECTVTVEGDPCGTYANETQDTIENIAVTGDQKITKWECTAKKTCRSEEAFWADTAPVIVGTGVGVGILGALFIFFFVFYLFYYLYVNRPIICAH